ncbi:MAG: hypothetical protein RL660_242 [Bacteroidota bacterium]
MKQKNIKMESKKVIKRESSRYKVSISAKFNNQLPSGIYEVAFRRWLVRELNTGSITQLEAFKLFNIKSKSGYALFHKWKAMYGDIQELPLVPMTAEEKEKVRELQKQVVLLTKKVEDGVVHVKALNTLIDIAEEQLKISIRKKSGTKQ